MSITEELIALDAVVAERSTEPDAEFDPDDPTCGRCGTSMRLNDMAEWEEDPRANVCNDCASSYYVALYDKIPKLLAEVRLLRDAVAHLSSYRYEVENIAPVPTHPLLRPTRRLGEP